MGDSRNNKLVICTMADHKATKAERQAFSASKADISKDPCYFENQQMLTCLARYCRESCQEEQVNYRLCRNFWIKIQAERRRKGVRPLLPGVEERKKLVDIYKTTGEFRCSI